MLKIFVAVHLQILNNKLEEDMTSERASNEQLRSQISTMKEAIDRMSSERKQLLTMLIKKVCCVFCCSLC